MHKTDADIAHIAAACAKQLRKDQKRTRDFARSAEGRRVAYAAIVAGRPGRLVKGR